MWRRNQTGRRRDDELPDSAEADRGRGMLRWVMTVSALLVGVGWLAPARAGTPQGVSGTDSVVFVSKGENGVDQGELAIRAPSGRISGYGIGNDDDLKIRAIGRPVLFDDDSYADIPFIIGGDGEDYSCTLDPVLSPDDDTNNYDSTNDEFHYEFKCEDNTGGRDDFVFDLSYSSGSQSFDFTFDNTTYSEGDYKCSTTFDDSDDDVYKTECEGRTNDDNEFKFDYKDDGSVDFDFDFKEDSNFSLDVDYDDGSFDKVDYESDTVQYDLRVIDIRGTETPKAVQDDVLGNNLDPESTVAVGHWGGDPDAIDIAFRNNNDGISIIDRTMSSPKEIVSDSVSLSDGDQIEPVAILGLGDHVGKSTPEVWWWDGDDGKMVYVDQGATSTVIDAGWTDDNVDVSEDVPGIGPYHDFEGEKRWPVVWDNGSEGAGVIKSDGTDFTLLDDDDKASGHPLTAANVDGDSRSEIAFCSSDKLYWVNSNFSSASTPKKLTDDSGDEIKVRKELGIKAATCVGATGLKVFNSFIRTGGVKSRTEAVFTDNLDKKNTSGQYRVYAGSRARLGAENFSGVLIRENRICGDSSLDRSQGPCGTGDHNADTQNDDYTCFHRQLNALVDQDGSGTYEGPVSNGTDQRRVWTSAPHPNFYQWSGIEQWIPHKGDSSCTDFHSGYPPIQGSTGDFESTYLDAVETSDHLLKRRLPFEEQTLRDTLVGSNTKHPFADNEAFYKWYDSWTPDTKEDDGTTESDPDEAADCGDGAGNPMSDFCDSRDTFEEMVDELRGRAASAIYTDNDGNTRERVLKGILNSDPAILDPPSGSVPADSYQEYQARMASRPSMVFQATHDGALHAFYSGEMNSSGNYVVKRQNESPNNIGPGNSKKTVKAANQREAWAYVPHLVHDKLTNYIDDKPELMDGKTTVQDVRLCYENQAYNNNFAACRIHCSNFGSGDSTKPSKHTCSSSTSCLADKNEAMYWRSVAVQGLGEAGKGYFALDVSRPGGPDRPDDTTKIRRPDPVPLWEFGPEALYGQLEYMKTESTYDERIDKSFDSDLVFGGCSPSSKGNCDVRGAVSSVGGGKSNLDASLKNYDPAKSGGGTATVTINYDDGTNKCSASYQFEESEADAAGNFWKFLLGADMTLMGKSVGAAGIGTVMMSPISSGEPNVRRSVAVFGNGKGGGSSVLGGANSDCEDGELGGEGAIYVVDLQTGSLLRRFLAFNDPQGKVGSSSGEQAFPDEITGSVAMFENGPGKLTTRAFVGDAEGRIYRIDFTEDEDDKDRSPDPSDWEVSIFYNPKKQDPGYTGELGSVTAKPSVALSRTNTNAGGDPIVIYGTGTAGDRVDSEVEHGVFAIREDYDARNNDKPGELQWYVDYANNNALRTNEKMTGKPKIFNGFAYFTTYQNEASNACELGTSRIWGLKFDEEPGTAGNVPTGAWAGDSPCTTYDFAACQNDGQWVQPEGASTVQGVSIAPGKNCQFDPDGATGSKFSSDSSSNGPSVVANTGGAESGTDSGEFQGSNPGDFINRGEFGAKQPEDFTVPMSWSVVDR